MESRKDYVERCKVRSREYLERGDDSGAVASMLSDMNSREDCKVHAHLAQLGVIYLMNNNHGDIVRYIEGFN